MSSETDDKTEPIQDRWPVLDLNERRVLGVLVEKAKTTPDAYPMSINALMTGCNQKSNRDPLMNLSDLDVEDTLINLQKRGLTVKVIGGRVERWRHTLYESWRVDKVDLAVLAELLLRGPQTEGELRGRASRMEPLDDLDALRAVLKPLATRRAVVYLTPEGRRGTMVTHGFHATTELERLRGRFKGSATTEEDTEKLPAPGAAPTPAESAVAPSISPDWEQRLGEAQEHIAHLTQEMSDLRGTVAILQEQIALLRRELGMES